MAELKVSKVKRGTVIDHIRAGMAPAVLRILGIDRGFSDVVVVAMNVKSSQLGSKDIVKVENQILDEETLKKISIIAPQATINIVKEFEIVEKRGVSLPKELRGILKCPNRNCITNAAEKVESFFVCKQENPIEFRCHYCEELVEAERAELIL
ncbi:MAG: aspartate carbamoyltransferase regulatory subunit [Candidatus Fraserbacteria bacterium RBG_16_55_9]|uniref:Aspartate carbamoyltransferase regulatory chain n=1 Tax=Fraserbacteria sp. (strain RBG_16_55_9) TaxID=1817864 RepID=A0A1F5V2N6_FRAXR|nr:MAG: aspartate carbamoyltransferase regulatory subunit [Candidatus Fraserbacteria bacterium RBG_16_55_9]